MIIHERKYVNLYISKIMSHNVLLTAILLKGDKMNTTNLAFLGLLFLLTNSSTITTTQALLLLTLLTTTTCLCSNTSENLT